MYASGICAIQPIKLSRTLQQAQTIHSFFDTLILRRSISTLRDLCAHICATALLEIHRFAYTVNFVVTLARPMSDHSDAMHIDVVKTVASRTMRAEPQRAAGGLVLVRESADGTPHGLFDVSKPQTLMGG